MRILITGASGQLGQDLQKECAARDIECVATDRLGDGGDSRKLDITDFAEAEELISKVKPEAIINCAAYNEVDKAEKDWERAFLVNSIGPKNLAILSNAHNIPLVHFSTDYVFDGRKGNPYTVWDRPSPLSKYGESKLYGEKIVSLFAKTFFILRLSWVFGVGNTNFVKKVLDWSKSKNELEVVNDQISCPSYTLDLARAIVDLLDTGICGIYHMTNTGHCSRYDWASYILELSGWNGTIIPVKSSQFKTAAKRPEFSALNQFPLKETVGYTLPDWRDATKRFLKELGVLD